jgi:nucleoid-associated protein YgaU
MIKLPFNNVFSLGKVISFTDNTFMLVREPLTIEGKLGDKYYTVKMGDRLEQLAWLHWRKKIEGAQFYWFVLADANKIINPLDLTDWVGKEILIPDIMRIKLEYDI